MSKHHTRSMATYFNKVVSTGSTLDVEGQEVERDDVSYGLVDDPLALLVVGVGHGVEGRSNLTRP